jgi:DNA-binding response OmpR family regulator
MSHQPHVLLVEDNGLVVDALAVLLDAAGVRVSTAASLGEAVTVGAGDPADLVLLDLTLPDGDGLEAIPALRASGSKRFVALTGHDDPATRDRCLAAGCTDVLLKPVPARELMSKVSAWTAPA